MLPETRLNIYWTVLAQGTVPNMSYVRRISPVWYAPKPEWLAVAEALIITSDDVKKYFQIEQLVQLVLHSNQRGRLMSFDSLNSYEKTALQFPAEGFGTNCVLPVFFQNTGENDISFDMDCTLNTIAQQFTTPAGVFPYTVSNNLSSPLPLAPGKTMRVQGPFPVATYQFRAAFVASLRVDWPVLLARLMLLKLPWSDNGLRDIWAADPSWVQRLAALIVNLVESNATEQGNQ